MWVLGHTEQQSRNSNSTSLPRQLNHWLKLTLLRGEEGSCLDIPADRITRIRVPGSHWTELLALGDWSSNTHSPFPDPELCRWAKWLGSWLNRRKVSWAQLSVLLEPPLWLKEGDYFYLICQWADKRQKVIKQRPTITPCKIYLGGLWWAEELWIMKRKQAGND